MTPAARRVFGARLLLIVLFTLLHGCAAQRAYHEGQELVEAGKTREGLVHLGEALRLEPRNTRYRFAYFEAREQAARTLLDGATSAVARSDYPAAEALFSELLAFDPSNARARSGLIEIRDRRERDQLLRQAQAARDAKDVPLAIAKVRQLLARYPHDDTAQALLTELEAKQQNDAPQVELAATYRKPVTLEFKDTALKTVFEVLSRASGLNFIFDKDVKTDAKTSIFLRNSTVENAIKLILLTNQLEQRVIDGNTLLLYPNTQAKQKDYQPLSVRSFYLTNATAKDVATTLKTILKTRDVVVDDKLNLLIMRDSPQAIRLAEKLVALHDVPEAEVMLEVEILEINRGRLVDLGVRWPDQLSLSPLASGEGDTLTLEELLHLDRTTTAATLNSAVINAKEQSTGANILANPRIRARNRESAKILIGERVPNITATATSTGFVSESVTYVDVGLKLAVEPTIYPNDEVAIDIALEVSNIINQLQTKSGSLAFQIGTRTASTVLRLKDGENQVLAGLINDEDRSTANGVPGLARLPLVGRLFRSEANDSNKTEIVLSITPRIVRNMQRPPALAAEFDSGTESSLGASIGGGAGTDGGTVAAATRSPAGERSDRQTKGRQNPQDDNTQRGDSQSRMNGNGNSYAPIGGGIPSDPDPQQEGAALVRWQGPGNLQVGDTFALQLFMQSQLPIVSIPLAVSFDPAVLQLNTIVEGDFLSQGGAQTTFTSRIEPSGQAVVTATRTGDSGATSGGSIATFNFRVLSATGESRVQLLAISPVALGGEGVSAPLPVPYVISTNP